ncbi:MAG: FAD-dependent oxidoreductase [Pseudomonadota bacterium]|nr:FAD-dependent oxidoreductase [Pseudomonadota bacterium]
MRNNITIIGGGIVGASIAYHLASTGKAGDIVVVERDRTYEKAATPRGSGGIRQLFSLPENIEMARVGLKFYQKFDSIMRTETQPASISFRRQGYLFVSDGGDAKTMVENFEKQQKLGVNAEILDRHSISQLFPSINCKDINLAVYSPDDAWIDAYSALQSFRAKSRDLGVNFLEDEIVAGDIEKGKISRLHCSSGQILKQDIVVLAAGAWSKKVASFFNVSLPIEPMSRESYFFRCEKELEPLPFIKTETDLAFRPEGDGYTGGVPDWSVKAGWNWELSNDYFQNTVWPALANRVPAMEVIKLERSWRGHYARNSLDFNAILGRWVGEPENLFLATGFSGHGIMHAPAAGLAMSELILTDKFQTIDLARFGLARIVEEKPYRESGII